ncbi:hypothetical protein BGZ83_011127 [Gryganskiella cystojenkinii]|nr:hypothetical protein BGZ83_011127 [Gryganskiella cystojenkinii]
MTSPLPTLPFVVLRAHKPGSAEDIQAQRVVAPPSMKYESDSRTSPFQPSSAVAPSSKPSSLKKSSSALSSGASIKTVSSGSSDAAKQTPVTKASTLGSISPSPSPSTVVYHQTRTLTSHVHYLFENDPLEAEILESIPKSRCITLDLDPQSGMISHVESYMPELQVMDVHWESLSFLPSSGPGQTELTPSQKRPSSSLSSSSSSASVSASLPATAVAASNSGSLTRSSTSSSVVMNSSSLPRRPSERNLRGQQQQQPGEDKVNSLVTPRSPSAPVLSSVSPTVEGEATAITTSGGGAVAGHKDLTLVIEVVEMDESDQQHSYSDSSELLDASMISSLGTDSIPEDYLSHCDALLKSFSSRNTLVKKVIDYTASHSSLSTTAQSPP